PRGKLDMTEAGGGKGVQKGLLLKCSANAAAPERGVGFELGGNRAAADDIADSGPAAGAENAEHFTEELLAVGFVHEVQDTVGEDDVDGASGNHGQVLNPPTMECHVVPADSADDCPLMFAGQCQHVLVHVDADDPPLWS